MIKEVNKMTTTAFLILSLLLIKHWYIDFVDQTVSEIEQKGIYGSLEGFMHSVKQALGTALVLLCFAPSIIVVFCLVFLDLFLHYHVDWIKSNYGCQDMCDNRFWSHLGFDQLIHQITYLVICLLL